MLKQTAYNEGARLEILNSDSGANFSSRWVDNMKKIKLRKECYLINLRRRQDWRR